ncbi:MAG TPA: aldehyde dehydrogenase family protein [Acidimicrobiia bacterium]|nr:aldehyde dehydrogenase family protein [Acidimicrobiia bacterium]
MGELLTLSEGMEIPYGGNRVTIVPAELATAYVAGDRLVVVQDSGDLLHIPKAEWDVASGAVGRAAHAFSVMGEVSDAQVTDFYLAFAAALEDDRSFGPIADANSEDVERAAGLGRSTTRLVLSDRMRRDMIEGLRSWAQRDGGRGTVVETVRHPGWTVELVRAGLGVVGFVFEGRPNVFADATGVLRAGNTVVFRIGSDALGTARAIVEHALDPALAASGLPAGAATLVDSPSRATGWAMFSDPRLSLAVARGSGPAVSQLGAVARQTGTSVSLHGTGGAWIVAADEADPEAFGAAVANSLDRKVCNTLNTCAIVETAAEHLVPVFLDSLQRAADERGAPPKLHVTPRARHLIPEAWFDEVAVVRAGGPSLEPRTEELGDEELGIEWEWERSPEVTLTVVDDVDQAVDLFNAQSPRFVASLISEDERRHESFWNRIDAPFVGNGFTRWVDGQYALDRPELGLSNWQFGRLFGRGGVLSGDSVYTIRTRVTQSDPRIGR